MRLPAKPLFRRPRNRSQVLPAAALLFILGTGSPLTALAQDEPAPAPAAAAELPGTPEHRAAAEELLKASSVEEMMTRSFDNVLNLQMRNMQGMNIPEDKKEKFAELQKRSGELIKEELSWGRIREDVISTYVETFSEDELKGLLEFYQGPLGKKLIEKQPVLMERTMKLAERQMQSLRPRLTALAGEIMGPVQPPGAEAGAGAEAPAEGAPAEQAAPAEGAQ
jgi:hypothetical protein